jgi:hypothetical protein
MFLFFPCQPIILLAMMKQWLTVVKQLEGATQDFHSDGAWSAHGKDRGQIA